VQSPPNNPDESDKALDERLSRLREKLDGPTGGKKQTPKEQTDEQNAKTREGVAQAFRLSSEFIAGVVVGTGIGYAIDQLFGTTPWGLILGLLLGFGAAVLNVMRAAGLVAESEMRLKSAQELHEKRLEEETEQKHEK